MQRCAQTIRVGLFRHFPVEEALPSGWKTAADLQSWRERYETANTSVHREFDLGEIPWQACIASDLPRARITARTVFPGEIEFTELLREPQFAQFNTGGLLLPVWGWRWLLRLTWITGHRSQRECRDAFRKQVRAIASRLSAVERDTLVVSHAGIMAALSAELRFRGFSGPKLRVAKHARAYVYELLHQRSHQ